MGIKNQPNDWEIVKSRRMCCCPKQDHLTQSDVQRLIKTTEWQLRNLPATFANDVDGKTPYEIRNMFFESQIPFRWQGCHRGDLVCCGCCTRPCKTRCAQDVLNRAYLICGNILDAPEDQREQRYKEASTPAQMIYSEWTSSQPRYFAIASMVTELSSSRYNEQLNKIIEEVYNNADSPYRYDYAPHFELEEVFKTCPNGQIERRLRKKVDPITGDASILFWPRSGMCPFCLPMGMVDRRRTIGGKKPRYKE